MFDLSEDQRVAMEAFEWGLGDRISAALEEAKRMIEANKRALDLLVEVRKARSYRQSMQLLDALGLVLGEIQDEEA